MKHATAAALDRLELLLVQLRRHDRLKEKSRGVFYLKSRAVLHFHEHPAGLFADLRESGDWQRFAVNTAAERAALVRTVARFLAARQGPVVAQCIPMRARLSVSSPASPGRGPVMRGGGVMSLSPAADDPFPQRSRGGK